MSDSEKTEPGILRAQAAALRDRVGHRIPDILEACADELSRLTARVAELEGALRGLVDTLAANDEDGLITEFAEPVCRARAALQAAAQGDTPHG